jgi:hypothetical protein
MADSWIRSVVSHRTNFQVKDRIRESFFSCQYLKNSTKLLKDLGSVSIEFFMISNILDFIENRPKLGFSYRSTFFDFLN